MFQKQEQCNLVGLMKSAPSPGYRCPLGLKINTGFQFDFPKLLPLCDGIHNWEGEIPSNLKPYLPASAMWLLRSQFKPNSYCEYSCQNSGICLWTHNYELSTRWRKQTLHFKMQMHEKYFCLQMGLVSGVINIYRRSSSSFWIIHLKLGKIRGVASRSSLSSFKAVKPKIQISFQPIKFMEKGTISPAALGS